MSTIHSMGEEVSLILSSVGMEIDSTSNSGSVSVQDIDMDSTVVELDESEPMVVDEPSVEEAIVEEVIIDEIDTRTTFSNFGLPEEIVRGLKASGYDHPTAIQEAMIPAVLQGRDVLGQAQTGTGKTAAFALPLLSRIDVEIPETQVLVLTPTRELAIQVADSFEKYGQHLRGLRVAPIYGGSSYATQIHALRRGAHVVVGTPGRVMDHMRESRLRIDTLQCLVLDEADEMLRMGFVDDVQWILEQSPENRQIALFSATMPQAIRDIANRHLKNPHIISINAKQRSAETIDQRYVMVDPRGKQEALIRILEAEDYDGVIVFVKTKIATVELADALTSHGFPAVALNGDIAQSQRERTIEQLKQGSINILVATDVAARGLDVQRITHVINYDLPFDAEAYVHRIGRTGRAGRAGVAIVMITSKQRGFLRELDRTNDQLEQMAIPTAKEINAMRVQRFQDQIVKRCAESESTQAQFEFFEKLLLKCSVDNGLAMSKVATALAMKLVGDKPFFVTDTEHRSRGYDSYDGQGRDDRRGRRDGRDGGRDSNGDRGGRDSRSSFGDQDRSGRGRRGAQDLETFRIEVGRNHGVKPGNIVGAIANEIQLDSNHIGQIRIFDEYSTVDLPSGMPNDTFKLLGKTWIIGRQLRISRMSEGNTRMSEGSEPRAPRAKKFRKPKDR